MALDRMRYLKPKWWWLFLLGAAMIAISLFRTCANEQMALIRFERDFSSILPIAPSTPISLQQVNPVPLHLNLGDLWRGHGKSMEPTIFDLDFILVLPSKAKPKVGQIILFEDIKPGTYVAHRVVEVGEDEKGWWAYTKGDNMKQVDFFYLRASNMLGVGLWRITIW